MSDKDTEKDEAAQEAAPEKDDQQPDVEAHVHPRDAEGRVRDPQEKAR